MAEREKRPIVSVSTKAWLVAAATFAVTFVVVYFVAHVIIGLVIVLTSLVAGLVGAAIAYNLVVGRPPIDPRWRRLRR